MLLTFGAVKPWAKGTSYSFSEAQLKFFHLFPFLLLPHSPKPPGPPPQPPNESPCFSSSFSTQKLNCNPQHIMMFSHYCLVTNSCLTLCDPMDLSPPGPSVHGIFLARILEWVVISSSSSPSCPIWPSKISLFLKYNPNFITWTTNSSCLAPVHLQLFPVNFPVLLSFFSFTFFCLRCIRALFCLGSLSFKGSLHTRSLQRWFHLILDVSA